MLRKKVLSMARVFISFAIEDKILRDFLVGQKKNSRNDINFTDYSVKTPWDSSWKTQCKQRINSCTGMIGIITPNTHAADGQLWELSCAITTKLPILLIHGYSDPNNRAKRLPSEVSGQTIFPWSEDKVVSFLNSL